MYVFKNFVIQLYTINYKYTTMYIKLNKKKKKIK